MHNPSLGSRRPAKVSRQVRTVLTILMSALLIATVVGLAVLWPSADSLPDKRAFIAEGAVDATGVVVAIYPGDNGGTVTMRLNDSDEEVTVFTNTDVPAESFSVGEKIRAIQLPGERTSANGDAAAYIYLDHYRGAPMALLLIVFAVVVVAVARLKGLAALVGLVGALATVWFFLLPALFAGKNALLVALVTASAVMFIVVYLAHGISVKTTTALLGTFIGVAIVTCLAWWAIPATKLAPMAHEELRQLAYTVPTVDVKGVLLCGMVLAGVGVLNDVTITQAATVWELRGAAPHSSRREIFAMAMRIGRDHIASTVYTIAFAYVGTALGLLMLGSTWDHTIIELLTFEVIAAELVAILVCSIGLVLTIPLTTAIAASLCGRGRQAIPLPRHEHDALTS